MLQKVSDEESEGETNPESRDAEMIICAEEPMRTPEKVVTFADDWSEYYKKPDFEDPTREG